MAFLTRELTQQQNEYLLLLRDATKVNSSNIEKLRSAGEELWGMTADMADDYLNFKRKVEYRFPIIKRTKQYELMNGQDIFYSESGDAYLCQ